MFSLRIPLLSARNLDLYQVLAPNAYSFKEEFIPVIRKTVQSQVHEVSLMKLLLSTSKSFYPPQPAFGQLSCAVALLRIHHSKTTGVYLLQKAMAQFPWHDGSMRNVHVDMTQLFEYQKQLGAMVSVYEKRVDWLSSASRKIMGSVTEKK